MFTVGCETSRSFAGSHARSSIQCRTDRDFFCCSSLRRSDDAATIARSSAEIGRGFG